MEQPFEIGQTFWRPLTNAEQVQIPCPVCAGHCRVKITLGSGEELWMPCDACGFGYEGPRGFIQEYTHEPQVERFVIASIQSFTAPDEWYLRSETGVTTYWKNLYPTEAEALVVAQQSQIDQIEHNLQARRRKKTDTSKHAWHVRYHREQIKKLERDLAYHRAQIAAKLALKGEPS